MQPDLKKSELNIAKQKKKVDKLANSVPDTKSETNVQISKNKDDSSEYNAKTQAYVASTSPISGISGELQELRMQTQLLKEISQNTNNIKDIKPSENVFVTGDTKPVKAEVKAEIVKDNNKQVDALKNLRDKALLEFPTYIQPSKAAITVSKGGAK